MLISVKNIDKIPQSCGVYIFKGKGKPLYVGKSVNLKVRVKSHFDSAIKSQKEASLCAKTDTIEYYLTNSEFEATILESKLIRRYKPNYNVRWRDDKNYLYIKITLSEEFPKVILCRKERENNKNLYFGPFSSVPKTEEILRVIRRIIPFCSEKKIGKKACFFSKIGLCQPCPNEINAMPEKEKKYFRKVYRSNIKKLINLLQGKIFSIHSRLEKELSSMIKQEKYEEAIILREKLKSLDELSKRRFITGEDSFLEEKKDVGLRELQDLVSHHMPLRGVKRIEAYDVSNLGGSFATGSCVVMIDGALAKTEYRRFKLDTSKKNDFDFLLEVFKRRFTGNLKNCIPDLIVIDGGKPQLRKIRDYLKRMNLEIPIIGIAKDPDRIILGSTLKEISPPTNHKGFNLIRFLRDEAHRFARKYHLLLRKKNNLVK